MAVPYGTVGGSSLNPNAPHSVRTLIQQYCHELSELAQSYLQRLHQDLEQEVAYPQWLHQYQKKEMAGFSEPPAPKNRMRPLSFQSKYREKPVQRVRPKKCSPRRIIHQPR